jgi:hypothetical protein
MIKNKKCWFYNNIIEDLFENDKKIYEKNYYFDRINFILGEEIYNETVNNFQYCILNKYICKEMNDLTMFILILNGKKFIFLENERICNCNEKIKNNNICQHLLLFKFLKKIRYYDEYLLDSNLMNKLIKNKYNLNNNESEYN